MTRENASAAPPAVSAPLPAMGRVSVVIPVYNSEHTVGRLVDAIVETAGQWFHKLEIVLVNDGSRDHSHDVLCQAARRHSGIVRYIRLARNFGEHSAVMCGLHHATGDCVVIMDDDFQNPPDEILPLVKKLSEGYDVVYSHYEHKQHSLFRNLGSAFNDWVAVRLLRKPRGLYLSSFKALNRFLVDNVTDYAGPYPYIDGLILRSTDSIGQQLCRHAPRAEGTSNYRLRTLIRLWLNMFTGFSIQPLRIASLLGLTMSATGFVLAAFFLFSWSVGGVLGSHEIPAGWASLIICVTIFAGLQLSVLGIIGEYVGRVFNTMNRAPQFVVRETVGCSGERRDEP